MHQITQLTLQTSSYHIYHYSLLVSKILSFGIKFQSTQGHSWSRRQGSVTHSCLTFCNPMDCSTPGFPTITNSRSLLKLMSIESSDAIQPSHPLWSPFHFAFHLSSTRVFSNDSSLHQVAKILEFQFQHQSFQWIFRTDFLRIDWFDVAVQGTLKSLLQHHSSKAPILLHSAFFMVQLSHPHTTTGKTLVLTRWTFVRKVMSMLFNMLSRFVTAFLPRS